eukprot:RCo017474
MDPVPHGAAAPRNLPADVPSLSPTFPQPPLPGSMPSGVGSPAPTSSGQGPDGAPPATLCGVEPALCGREEEVEQVGGGENGGIPVVVKGPGPTAGLQIAIPLSADLEPVQPTGLSMDASSMGAGGAIGAGGLAGADAYRA